MAHAPETKQKISEALLRHHAAVQRERIVVTGEGRARQEMPARPRAEFQGDPPRTPSGSNGSEK